jgi:hypothetical protein
MIGRSSFLAKSVARNISTHGFRRLASTKVLDSAALFDDVFAQMKL